MCVFQFIHSSEYVEYFKASKKTKCCGFICAELGGNLEVVPQMLVVLGVISWYLLRNWAHDNENTQAKELIGISYESWSINKIPPTAIILVKWNCLLVTQFALFLRVYYNSRFNGNVALIIIQLYEYTLHTVWTCLVAMTTKWAD